MDITLSKIIETVFICVLVYLAFKVLEWLIEYMRTLWNYRKVKGRSMIPFIGHLHQITNNGVDFLQEMKANSILFKNEPVFMLWTAWQPNIIFHRSDYIDILYSSSKHTVKSFDYSFIKEWLGDGLLISDGEKWKLRRKLITPTFHFDILNDFLVVMNENAEICVANLVKLADTGKELDINQKIGLCALDIICETAMGENINAQNEMESDYINAVSGISILIAKRIMDPLIWNDAIYSLTAQGKEYKKHLNVIHKFTRSIIEKRDEEFDCNNFGTTQRVAFLDLLLKMKHTDNSLTLDDIQNEVDTFMFAGHDTTTTALSWACHCIGSNPDVQTRIHDEIDSIFGDSKRHVTNEDLGNLNYLELVIKETLRMFPAVPAHSRVFTEDAKIGDFVMKKGHTALVLTYMLHRDERYFPNPEKFDPNRFLPENSKDRHAYAYLPFSAGKRNCVGQRFAMMEMKVILASLMRKFEIKSDRSVKELEPCLDLVLKPNKGMPVTLMCRKNN